MKRDSVSEYNEIVNVDDMVDDVFYKDFWVKHEDIDINITSFKLLLGYVIQSSMMKTISPDLNNAFYHHNVSVLADPSKTLLRRPQKDSQNQANKIQFGRLVNLQSEMDKKESKCKIICVGLKKELANEREIYSTINHWVIYILPLGWCITGLTVWKSIPIINF